MKGTLDCEIVLKAEQQTVSSAKSCWSMSVINIIISISIIIVLVLIVKIQVAWILVDVYM